MQCVIAGRISQNRHQPHRDCLMFCNCDVKNEKRAQKRTQMRKQISATRGMCAEREKRGERRDKERGGEREEDTRCGTNIHRAFEAIKRHLRASEATAHQYNFDGENVVRTRLRPRHSLTHTQNTLFIGSGSGHVCCGLVNIVVVNIYNVTNVKINLFDYEHLVCKSFISIKCGFVRSSIKNENVCCVWVRLCRCGSSAISTTVDVSVRFAREPRMGKSARQRKRERGCGLRAKENEKDWDGEWRRYTVGKRKITYVAAAN